MATVTPLFSFGDRNGGDLYRPAISRDESSGEIEPLKFKVDGLVAGEDPTTVTGIPQPNSAIVVAGRQFLVDRVGVREHITDGSTTSTAFVEVYCSTDRRFRFPTRPVIPEVGDWNISTSFRTETRTAPTFITRPIVVPQSDGIEFSSLEWAQEPIQYTIDMMVLTVSATLPDQVDKALFLEMVQIASAQNGYLHSFLNRYWRFTPPHFDRSAQGIVSIVYNWESDPGNWEIGATVGNGTQPGHTRAAPVRPPFFEYQVVGSGEFGIPPPPPTVLVTDLYPDQANNPYVDLDGWQTLPGNPLG